MNDERREDEGDLTRTIELVRGYQNGNLADLNRLCERYFPRLLLTVRARMGPVLRSKIDPEDIVQEALVVAMDAMLETEFTEEAGFRRWLATVALNRVKNAAKRLDTQKRDPHLEIALESLRAALSSGELRLDLPATDRSPSSAASFEEDRERLEQSLDELSDDHREVILLRDFEQGTWRWVGEQLGRSADAASMLYGRAMGKLAECMDRRS